MQSTIQWQDAGPCAPVLDSGAIHLWRISLEEDSSPFLVEARRRVLRPDEIARAERFYTQRLRDHFVLCRGALRTILGWYTGVPPDQIVLQQEHAGKPVMRAVPGGHDAGPEFNLSHSGQLALVALTLGNPVGVDVERAREVADADRLAERFFAAREYERYRMLPPHERSVGFLTCWTRKEAFIKAIGEGLSRPLASFEVTVDPREPARLLRIDGHPGEEHRWSLYAFEPAAGYIAAVATRARPALPSFFRFC
jgi:4'-phosphopantetheinyl transferase